jgi:hypothetical protein
MIFLIIGILTYSDTLTPEISSLTRVFRYGVVGSSLLAITADWFVEHYHQKYKKAETPLECTKYREDVMFWENVRNISIWSVGISLIGSIVSEKIKKPKKSKLGFIEKIHIEVSKNISISIYYAI